MLIFDAVTKTPGAIGHGRDGYYFGISDDSEYSWYDLTKEVGKALVELGVHKESEPETFQKGELTKCFGSEVSVSVLYVMQRGLTHEVGIRLVLWHELARRGEPFEVAWVEPEEGCQRLLCEHKA